METIIVSEIKVLAFCSKSAHFLNRKVCSSTAKAVLCLVDVKFQLSVNYKDITMLYA